MINETDVREREGQPIEMTAEQIASVTQPNVHGITMKVTDLPAGTVVLAAGQESEQVAVMTNVGSTADEVADEDPALAQYPRWQLEMRKAQAESNRIEARKQQEAHDQQLAAQAARNAKLAPVMKLALSLFGIEAEPTSGVVSVPGGYTFYLEPGFKVDGKKFQFRMTVHRSLPEGVFDQEFDQFFSFVSGWIDTNLSDINLYKSGTPARMADLIDSIDKKYDAAVQRHEDNLKRKAEAASNPAYALPVAATDGEALEATIRRIVRDEINGATHYGE